MPNETKLSKGATWQGLWPYATANSDTPVAKRGNAVTRWLGRSLLKLGGFKLTGTIPEEPFLIAAVGPHSSNWDFVHGMAVQMALGVDFSFMIKSSAFVPVLGRIIRFFGGIPINRSAAQGVTGEMVTRFSSGEPLILVITPEGTRSKKGPLKSGFHRIAQAAKVPVLLVSIDYKNGIFHLGEVLDYQMPFEAMAAKLDEAFGPCAGRKGGSWLDKPVNKDLPVPGMDIVTAARRNA